MSKECSICRGAIPEGVESGVHTALCAEVMRVHLAIAVEALEWYADYGAGAAKEPKALPSQGVAVGMLQHDGGTRARNAIALVRGSKILHTSDWHLDWRTVGVARFDEVRAASRQTVEAAIRQKVDLYAFTGDLADSDGGTGVLRCVEVAIEVATLLSNAGIESCWVAGNHDVVEDGTGLTTLSPLRALGFGSMVRVFEQPRVAEVDDCALLALPYPAATNPYDPVAFVREAKALRGFEKVVVLTHLQVEGAQLGEETTDMPRGRDVRFPHEECGLGWTILAGHYHKRQTIARPGLPPVHVVGALARLAFGEQSNTPSYSIIEL
jgi:DNA repair exonuclease SbcCD nuclease subunit